VELRNTSYHVHDIHDRTKLFVVPWKEDPHKGPTSQRNGYLEFIQLHDMACNHQLTTREGWTRSCAQSQIAELAKESLPIDLL